MTMIICSQCSEPAVIAPFPASQGPMYVAVVPDVMFSTLVSEPYCAKHSPFQWVTDTSQVQWFPEANCSPPSVPTGVLLSTKASQPTFDTSRLLADGEAAQREIERLRAALADAERSEQLEREHADYLLNENAGLRAIAQAVAAAAETADGLTCRCPRRKVFQHAETNVRVRTSRTVVDHQPGCMFLRAQRLVSPSEAAGGDHDAE